MTTWSNDLVVSSNLEKVSESANLDWKKKGQYERGDAKYSIVLLANTTIETIGLVCVVRRLLPDMMISELLFSNDNYVVGTIAAIVVAAQHNNRHFEFYIKDGEIANNHATAKTYCLHWNIVIEKYHFQYIYIQNASRPVSFQPFKNINQCLFLSSIATSWGTI